MVLGAKMGLTTIRPLWIIEASPLLPANLLQNGYSFFPPAQAIPMRFCYSLASANVITLCLLIFVCGCQGQPAATQIDPSSEVANTSLQETEQSDGSEQIDSVEVTLEKEALIRAALNQDDLGQSDWVQDSGRRSEVSPQEAAEILDSTLTSDTQDPAELSTDTRDIDGFLRESLQE